MRLLVGTYTRGTLSEGIYRLAFDPGTCRFTEPELAIATRNPSWLLAQGNRLIVANEHGDADGCGELSVFEHAPGGFRRCQTLSSRGADPCHLGLSGNRLAAANYTGGNVALWEWTGTGLGAPIDLLTPERTGPHPRQRAPHPHGVYFIGSELWIPDLGGDCIHRHDPGDGRPLGRIDVSPGAGPRHLTAAGDYLINELDNTVQAIDGDRPGRARVSTLPEASRTPSIAAEIQSHRGCLYVSNRGHDSIAVLTTSPELAVVQHVPSGGRHPRHFLVTPDGGHLIVANRDSHNLVAIALDIQGRLVEPVAEVACPSPVHLLAY